MQATYALIGINVFVFVLQLLGGGPSGTDGSLFAHGALCGNAVGDGGICGGGGQVIQSAGGEWWRIITSGFLHSGFLHIALNMYILYWLGQMIEPALGHLRFTALYFASLIAGSIGALLLSPDRLTVGAPKNWMGSTSRTKSSSSRVSNGRFLLSYGRSWRR